jgi:hypothetical protein
MGITLEEWLARATINYAVYTPGELERISGLGTDMQRVWRRRGQLPALGSGHARFSIPEAIEITIRYALSKVGIAPSELELDLSEATSATMLHAVYDAEGACEIIGPADEVDLLLETFRQDNTPLPGRLVAGLLGSSPKSSHYLIINEWHETRIVDDPYHIVPETEELNIVFNLAPLGARLVERGRKPVVTIQFPDRSGHRTVRRLTGVGANDS